MTIRSVYIFLSLLLIACGGKLSDEERQKVKDGMKANEIRKVTDAEFTEAAFEFGRNLYAELKIRDPFLKNEQFIDSLENTRHVLIFPLKEGDSLLLQIEQQIIEAYTAADGNVTLTDNIQEIGTDSVLYTQPVMIERPDGSTQFSYALGIKIPNKQIILSIEN
jgi:hypothetical protein